MSYEPHKIESHWQLAWKDARVFEAKIDYSKEKFYCLEMFPYPSGNMHMGHVRNYSIGDAMARFQRLMGKNVLYPMGYDSFGMPAENAAKRLGDHPHEVTKSNIRSIRSDQERMGFSYDWNRYLATSDVDYYRWNQDMFLTLNEKGLVERRAAPVNWCNDCDTVLANEQVKNNRCWRCGLEVVQKDMAQWFLRMTEYSDELLDELDQISFPENVKTMQRNWIGRSHGAEIEFSIAESNSKIQVFTTRPDTIFGATFVTLSPEHPLCEELCSGTKWHEGWLKLRDECARMSEFERINLLKEKNGVFLGRFAINPMNNEKIPIYAGNFVVASYGTGAVMAVPGHDQRDFEFAKKYDLEIRRVLVENEGDNPDSPISRAFEGYGPMVNSTPKFDGLKGEEAKKAVIDTLHSRKTGFGKIEYRLKDWLLSRQRFWGTPIPMIHCHTCGVIPVNREDLPVELPLDVIFSEDQKGNPLETHESFTKAVCPRCGSEANRETDTMDTFYDSSWYFMRFCDAKNNSYPFDREAVDYWMKGGVDLYIGGIEHAVMHLLYARFFTKFTRDVNMNTVGEPFGRLVCQGMLNAPAPYCLDCNAEYHIDYFGKDCPSCSKKLSSRSAKMSKSLGNTVSPEKMISRYGADTVRLFILFGANPEAGMDWSDSSVEANNKQLKSIFESIKSAISFSESPSRIDDWILARLRLNMQSWQDSMNDVNIREGVMISHFEMLSDWNWYIRRGGCDFSTSISFLKGWISMLAPATPHIAEELWQLIGQDGLLAQYNLEILTENYDDLEVISKENFLRDVIATCRNIRTMAERKSNSKLTKLVLQTSPNWKNELASKALELVTSDFNFKENGISYIQSLPIFEENSLRAEVMQTWMSLTVGNKKKRGRVFTWSKIEKSLISNLDEKQFLLENSEFIRSELELDSIEIYRVGEGEDVAGKANSAFPLEPGISFLS